MTIMKPEEIVVAVAESFLAEYEGPLTWEVSGNVIHGTRGGTIKGGRPANVRLSFDKEIAHVRVNIPGNGNLAFGFTLFSDDATEERIQRYINHHKAAYEKNLAKWEAERLNY